MKCSIHLEKEQISSCTMCGDKICEDCLVDLDGQHFCKKCIKSKMAVKPITTSEKKSRFWAFVFSLVPGVGYLYLGAMNRGLQTLTVFFGSIFLASFIGFEQIMALTVPVVMFYSIFETQQLAKEMNAGYPMEDKQFFDLKKIPWTQKWLGYALVVIGILALLNNLTPYFPFWFTFKKLIPPALVIGLGVFILYRHTKDQV